MFEEEKPNSRNIMGKKTKHSFFFFSSSSSYYSSSSPSSFVFSFSQGCCCCCCCCCCCFSLSLLMLFVDSVPPILCIVRVTTAAAAMQSQHRHRDAPPWARVSTTGHGRGQCACRLRGMDRLPAANSRVDYGAWIVCPRPNQCALVSWARSRRRYHHHPPHSLTHWRPAQNASA